MCRASTEPGGPRRCSGDTRAAYSRAAALVMQLEKREAALLTELAETVGGPDADGPGERRTVTFADKATRSEDVRREIDNAISELATADRWREFLEVSRRFHQYSLNNQLLISMQKPDATRVAGFHKWKEFGRSVNKGERAIWIYAPMLKRVVVEDENGKQTKEERLIGYKVVPVFDVSSTNGAPLPEPPLVPFTRSEGRAPEGMHEDLRAQVEAHGYTLVYTDLGEGDHIPDGSTDPVSKTVMINTCYSDAHQAKTLAHELAHIELGHLERTADYHTRAGGQRSTMEVEAESVSYVVSRRYGMDAPSFSFAYIDGWAQGDSEKVRRTADAVVKASDRILSRIKRFSS